VTKYQRLPNTVSCMIDCLTALLATLHDIASNGWMTCELGHMKKGTVVACFAVGYCLSVCLGRIRKTTKSSEETVFG
jgi:uncharacterized membrane protein YczE